MGAKFTTGDKVRLRRKGPVKYLAPDYILNQMRGRTRTIVSVEYIPRISANIYALSGRGKGELGYMFRSYQLVKAPPDAKPGRPRVRRKRQPSGALPYRSRS